VPGDNRLLFIFKDGRTEERTWVDKTRRDGAKNALLLSYGACLL
jgi:hypothetical protein